MGHQIRVRVDTCADKRSEQKKEKGGFAGALDLNQFLVYRGKQQLALDVDRTENCGA